MQNIFILGYNNIGDYMLVVKGNNILNGSLSVSGSKNAVLPIIAATLAVDGTTVINNVPKLDDVTNLCEILKTIGCKIDFDDHCLKITNSVCDFFPPKELINKLRASFIICGPMLAKYKKIRISLPGGCKIGARPVDLHLKGFVKMGAQITEGEGYIELTCSELSGAKICLDFPSVGATENIVIAATLAKGTTEIINAATEPEVADLCNFLVNCGADIKGIGTNELIITGVDTLNGCNYHIIPDRIEAGTYMLATAITGGDVTIQGIDADSLIPITSKLREMGASIFENKKSIRINCKNKLSCVNIKTMPHPGFPTDMQAQFCSLMCNCEGTGIITETIFENRFMYINELLRMHAQISVEGRNAIVKGKCKLQGCDVYASDLRAGAALAIASLCASGTTNIFNSSYINRGYENFAEKLKCIGADIYFDNSID